MRFYCVAHRPITFDPGRDFRYVSAVAFPDHNPIVIADGRFGPAFDGRILSEYTQLFGLSDQLEQAAPEELIFLFQYRKFVSLRPSSTPSTNMPPYFVAGSAEAASLFPLEKDLLAATAGRTLLGPRLGFNSLAQQYSRAHLAADFTCFALALTLLDDFDATRAARFASFDAMSPSPGMGLFSIGTFRRHMDVLRRAWSAFHAEFYVPRTDYQRRVGGFLLERLHSFLLLEEASDGAGDGVCHGHLVVVSDSPVIAVTA